MYNPLIRYTMLNCLKLNNTGMVVFLGIAAGESQQLGVGIAIIIVMTAIPIFYAVLIFRKRKDLNKEETKMKFNSLYLGLKLDGKNRTIWLYPLLWMLRRSIFMAITTGLFHYPVLQFAANYALTIPYIAYLAHKKSMFDDGKRRFVEVFTEFMVMISTTLL